MPAPYIRETQRGGLWCVMYKNAYPGTGDRRDEIKCGILATFTTEASAREYAKRNADRIHHLEKVTQP